MMRKLILMGCAALLILSGSVAAGDLAGAGAFEVRWSPDGHWLSVGSNNGVWIFDATHFDAEPYHYYEGSSIYAAAFDPLHPYMAFAPGDNEFVRVVKITTGEEVFRADTPRNMDDFFDVFYDLDYSSDGKYLAVVNTSLLYVLDAATGDEVFSRQGGQPDSAFITSSWVTDLDFGSLDTLVATSNWGGSLVVYPIRQPEKTQVFALDLPYGIERLETIPATRRLVLLQGNSLSFYDPITRTLTTEDAITPVYGFDLYPDRKLLAVGSADAWYLYDLDERHVLQTFSSAFNDIPIPRIYSLAFNPAGTQVATLQTDGQFKIWDIASGQVIATLGEFVSGVSQRWG